MAKSVIINGVTYADVPYVNIPLSEGGGNAKFVDTDSGDAAAGDIRSGKKAWVDGSEVTGSVPVKTASDVTVSGKTVTIPVGIYDSSVTKSVADGSVTPTATVMSDVLTDSGSSSYRINILPSATVSAGYVSGNVGGESVVKYVNVQEKNVTPSTSANDVSPDFGFLLSKVHVNAVSLTGNASASDVLAGKTFYNTTLSLVTGTATVPIVGQDSTTKVLTIS